MFDENIESTGTVSENQITELLDREAQFKLLEEEESKEDQKEGVLDYLSSFKVATFEV